MKRRDAIKRLGYAAGFVVATPTIFGLLNSCSTPSEEWIPKYLSPNQGEILIKLVDVFLPETELPSATELNVPEFIDRYVNEILSVEDQEEFKTGFSSTIKKLTDHSGVEIDAIEDTHLKAFLDDHLKVKDEKDLERIDNPDFKGMTTSEFLNTIKTLSIQAYLTTEKIGEEVLAYEPVPGAYYCGDLQELTQGKAWSLDVS